MISPITKSTRSMTFTELPHPWNNPEAPTREMHTLAWELIMSKGLVYVSELLDFMAEIEDA